MTNAILRGKPDAGNPHVRFDEGEVASAKPRRGSLLYNSSIKVLLLSLIVSTGVFNSSGFTHVNFRLPEGYSQLEYLESTGAQRIMLSTPIGPNSSVKMNFRPTTYKAMTAFFGYAWNRSQYLFNWQSDQYMFHSSGNNLASVPGSIGKDCCFKCSL